jgi:hypothetical protein
VSALLLVPLGAYWWSFQSTDWLLQLETNWLERRKRVRPQPHEA